MNKVMQRPKAHARRSTAQPPKRIYRQAVRAQKTEANLQGIIDAAVLRVRSSRHISDIKLEEIAHDAGLTVRTVLRRFGSKENLLAAAFDQLRREIEGHRAPTPAGDIEAGLQAMLHQYEVIADLNFRALTDEDQLPLLHEMLQAARRLHREWLVYVFGPYLPKQDDAFKEEALTALYAATDIYLWKLLRRDLGVDAMTTAAIYRRLVYGVLQGLQGEAPAQPEGRSRL